MTAGAPRIVILEHDPSDPPLLLGEWLAEAGAEVEVRRLHAGDGVPELPQRPEPSGLSGVHGARHLPERPGVPGVPGMPGASDGAEIPDGQAGFDALVSMGGEMGATDDDVAPWLPETRRLLAAAAAGGVPTLGVCLGAQLLAVATGGRVERGPDGPEIGAYLMAKRDAAETDPLFAPLPLSPDVMHFHQDVISALPPGGVLLLSSTGYPNQAFRVGAAAWGIQFHIETTAQVLRSWGEGGSPARRGALLDDAEQLMGQVWRDFAHRFVQLAREGVPQTPTGRVGPRLPVVPGGPAVR